MKKILFVVLIILSVAGCSSVEYHNGRNSLVVQNITIEPKPLQADIKVGQKITGVAECESWFGFYTKQPTEQTYGAELQVPEGNFVPSQCTRGALYDALNKYNADVIVSPHYTSFKKGDLCILGFCIHTVNKVIVTGYKGNIENISTMEKAVVIERQKQGTNINTTSTKKFGLF